LQKRISFIHTHELPRRIPKIGTCSTLLHSMSNNETPKKPSIKILFFYWFFSNLILLMVGTILAILYWSKVNEVWQLNTVSAFVDMFVMLPVGLLVSLIAPVGIFSNISSWLIFISFILVCKTKSIKMLYLSAASSLVFGLLWPMLYWQMMSV